MFGAVGQELLSEMSAAIIGLGGGGSIVAEHMAHLGLGEIVAVDFDRVENHNLSRIVGASRRDALRHRKKVKVAQRLAHRVSPSTNFVAIDGDIADPDVAAVVSGCDFIFLCTDTISSRLVANSIAQAYLIPMVQIGAKVDRPNDEISSVYVAVRPSLPRQGCLDCAGMIDPAALQREGATDEERAAQNYLDLPDVIDPSVITLNAVAASAATNLMLMYAVGMGQPGHLSHRLLDARSGSWLSLVERRDSKCLWCGTGNASRFARGDRARLPVRILAGNASSGSSGRLERFRHRVHRVSDAMALRS
jgi:molybdopterin/thiamine biosynthesis adenylyltransferase